VTTGTHLTAAEMVPSVMVKVLCGLVPAILVQAAWFGTGVLTNIGLAVLFAWLFEAGALVAQRKPVVSALRDGSVTVTALLLALALPPTIPTAYLAFGVGMAVLVAKHAYGGLGFNPFNPAMVGYAAVLVSFPAAAAVWPEPSWMQLHSVDALTAATALDEARHLPLALKLGIAPAASTHPDPWVSINGAYLAGGAFIVAVRAADGLVAAGVLVGLALAGMVAFGGVEGMVFHLGHGAAMAGAFFIATDPVSAPRERLARGVYALAIGVLTVVIREAGGYPDGLAFAVLLLNAAAPLLDQMIRAK
jgi:Na+-translocating ferredoxin:NAD+ oxidoreductase subunit D